jgi:L-ascorbate metabolism protein UlaG (beta-lactamase superfamily)
MTNALHSCSIKDGDNLLYGGEAAGYVLSTKDGRKAYFSGDTALFGDMALIGDFFKPELAFLPIGDHFTMGPEQAAQAARMLKVKSVIPMHYGTFPALTGTPEALQSELGNAGVKVITLKQAQPFTW